MKQAAPALAIVLLLCAAQSAFAQGPQLVPDVRAYSIDVTYYAPRDPSLRPLYQTLQKRQVLEELGQFLAAVKWPTTLHLVAKQCPQSGTPTPEVFYNGLEYSLTICYQLFTQSLQPAAASSQAASGNAAFATPREVLVGGLVGTVLHEASRAAFDMLQIPQFGSDEDAADQLAGLIGLQFGSTVARTVIKGTYYLFDWYSFQIRSKNQQYNFAGRSSVPPQRAENILCIAYGGDPADFKDFVDKGLLSGGRAPNCAREYKQVAFAFDRTVKPHVDAALMKKALSMTWITPDDLK